MNNKDCISVLHFEKYIIDEFEFRTNKLLDEKEKIKLEFEFSGDASISGDKSKAIVKVGCKVFDEQFKENKAPIYLNCCIKGFFACSPNMDIEKLKLNATAILFPYLRAFITSFTAQTGILTITVPVINVYKLFDHHKVEDDEKTE